MFREKKRVLHSATPDQEVFLFDRKVLCTSLSNKKHSVQERTAAERKMLLKQPAAGGESCFAGFFFIQTLIVTILTVFASGVNISACNIKYSICKRAIR